MTPHAISSDRRARSASRRHLRLGTHRAVTARRRRVALVLLAIALIGFAVAWWNNRVAAATITEVVETWIRRSE